MARWWTTPVMRTRKPSARLLKLVIVPVCYMCSEETGRHLTAFVERGGTLVVTYWSGIADRNDQCHLGGFPGPLREVTGVWAEEYNALAPHRRVEMEWTSGTVPGLEGSAEIRTVVEGLRLQGSEALATFTGGRYEGQPAVTRNRFGKGRAYYLGAKLPHPCLKGLVGHALTEAGVRRIHGFELPAGVYVTERSDAEGNGLFVMNFTAATKTVALEMDQEMIWPDARTVSGTLELPAFGLAVLRNMFHCRESR